MQAVCRLAGRPGVAGPDTDGLACGWNCTLYTISRQHSPIILLQVGCALRRALARSARALGSAASNKLVVQERSLLVGRALAAPWHTALPRWIAASAFRYKLKVTKNALPKKNEIGAEVLVKNDHFDGWN